MRMLLQTALVLAIPSMLGAQETAPIRVALDRYGADPMAYAGTLVELRGVRVQHVVGPRAFFFSVPAQRAPFFVIMVPEVVLDGGVIEVGATVSVTGTVYGMSNSVADALVASGGIPAEHRQQVVFNEWFFEAASVTVTGR